MTFVRSLNAAVVVFCCLVLLTISFERHPVLRGVLLAVATICTFAARYEDRRP